MKEKHLETTTEQPVIDNNIKTTPSVKQPSSKENNQVFQVVFNIYICYVCISLYSVTFKSSHLMFTVIAFKITLYS